MEDPTEKPRSGKLPDPLAEISRLKRKLNPKSSVAKSKYVDFIISFRMQGVNYQRIEKWLAAQGQEHRIPASTIFRNTRTLDISLPLMEEIADRWGGRIDVDLARELASQLVAQRMRVDCLQRSEFEAQKINTRYLDRRIRAERELLTMMIKELHSMLKDPMVAAEEALAADEATAVTMTDDGRALLQQMILDGEIVLGNADLFTHH